MWAIAPEREPFSVDALRFDMNGAGFSDGVVVEAASAVVFGYAGAFGRAVRPPEAGGFSFLKNWVREGQA